MVERGGEIIKVNEVNEVDEADELGEDEDVLVLFIILATRIGR